MNIPSVASPRTAPTVQTSALTRLDRVISELRRSGLVLVRHGAKAFWVMAAENVTAHRLHDFLSLSTAAPSLVLTGQRAYRLGFEVERHTSVYNLHGFNTLSIADIQAIVDPVYAQTADASLTQQLSALSLSPAGEIETALIAMVKHGRLLPAVLTLEATALDAVSDPLEISLDDIKQGLQQASSELHIVAQARVPLEDSEQTRIVAFRPRDGGIEHLAIIVGEPDINGPVLIRIHSECYTGDLVGSLRCDCGPQLRGAIALMASAGSGIVLYMAQEGRGIGLINKLRAYQLQDSGRDTVDANLDLGFEEDERDYQSAVEMLKLLDVKQVRLLTNNPKKVNALTRWGVNVVERVAHVFPANHHNRGYLYTKGSRGGHLLDLSQYVSDAADNN